MEKSKRTRPIGAAIGIFFGGLWAFLGSQTLPPPWSIAIAIAGFAISAALIVWVWRQPMPLGNASAMFGRAAYGIAVILEVLAIYAVSTQLPHYGLNTYLIPCVGVIVGLHFIGLWQASQMTRFLWIAGAMTIVSLAAMFFPAAPLDLRDAVTGFGNALVLWFIASRPPK